jgi:HAD superfamily hydrolase (TIGR01484 family)
MNAYIFDVDGVITNPSLKLVEHKEILQKIANLLSSNNLIALNTGRSLSWVNERIILPLLQYISAKTNLKNLFAVGEKGGTWFNFDDNGAIQFHKDESISVPFDLQEKTKELISNSFSDTMFYDDTKETMISTEMRDGFSIDEYKKNQKELIAKMAAILGEMQLAQTLKIDPTTIATDIENRMVGKDYAMERIIDWINHSGLKPEKFITFGDSKSDIPMAEKLYEHKLPVSFVYVGDDNLNTNSMRFPTITTKEKFDKGTLEYLTKIA